MLELEVHAVPEGCQTDCPLDKNRALGAAAHRAKGTNRNCTRSKLLQQSIAMLGLHLDDRLVDEVGQDLRATLVKRPGRENTPGRLRNSLGDEHLRIMNHEHN